MFSEKTRKDYVYNFWFFLDSVRVHRANKADKEVILSALKLVSMYRKFLN